MHTTQSIRSTTITILGFIIRSFAMKASCQQLLIPGLSLCLRFSGGVDAEKSEWVAPKKNLMLVWMLLQKNSQSNI